MYMKEKAYEIHQNYAQCTEYSNYKPTWLKVGWHIKSFI